MHNPVESLETQEKRALTVFANQVAANPQVAVALFRTEPDSYGRMLELGVLELGVHYKNNRVQRLIDEERAPLETAHQLPPRSVVQLIEKNGGVSKSPLSVAATADTDTGLSIR